MIKVISEKPIISFKHVCTKCGYELEYNEIDLVCNRIDYEGDSIEKRGMYLVCPRTECNHYQGSCRESGGYFRAGSNHYLVQNDDLGRAYSPELLTENQIPHHSHNWSIGKEKPTHDLPKCVLDTNVFSWVNEELKKRMELLRKA